VPVKSHPTVVPSVARKGKSMCFLKTYELCETCL
jgi:hypothetical protein